MEMEEEELMSQTMRKLVLLNTEMVPLLLHQQLLINVISVATTILLSFVLSAWIRVSVLLVMKCITNIQKGLVISESL